MERFIWAKDGTRIFVRLDGDTSDTAPAIVFSNALGTSLEIWDEVVAELPKGLRIIRYDQRGHGRSQVPDGAYAMGALIGDAEAVCDALSAHNSIFVGLSVGGMVAQGLAVKRLDLVRGLVLSNTAAKIGHPQLWKDRIKAIERLGLPAVTDDIMKRWFSKGFLGAEDISRWAEMVSQTDPKGYCGVCHAIAGTDFYTPTSGLRLPTLGIAGREDGSTPPDLVKETIDLIPGADFHLIRRAGHLPCIEQPKAYAELITAFMARLGLVNH